MSEACDRLPALRNTCGILLKRAPTRQHSRKQSPKIPTPLCLQCIYTYLCMWVFREPQRTLGIPIQYMIGTITFVDFLGGFVQRVLYQKNQNTSAKHDPNILGSSTKAATSHPIIGIPLDTTAAQILTWSMSI